MMPSIPICPVCGESLVSAGGSCAACMLKSVLSNSAEPSAEPIERLALPRAFGAYELLEEIARGGMGIVYRARQVALNRVVGLKLLIGGAYSSESLLRRFQTEAEAAAALQHPGIVAIHEFGEFDHQPYYTMDYVEGRNLAEVVSSQPLAPARAARYLYAISEAVQFAHTKGILHRDLKPSNILIDEHDRPRITDFGLAKRLQAAADVTLAGQMLGSPNYAPPEQAPGRKASVGVATDIYSMGALLYCLLTSRPPFLASTIQETLRLVEHAEPVAPRVLNPAVPRDLETICLKCLEKDPARRYQSAQLLAEELMRFRQGQPILARPIPAIEQAFRWGRRHPMPAALAATVALALASTATVFYLSARRVEQARTLEQAARVRAEQNLYATNLQLASFSFSAAGGVDPEALREELEQARPLPGRQDLRGFEWRHFWLRSRNESVTALQGHGHVVDAALYSPDGTQLATHSIDGTLKLWTTANGHEVVSVQEVAVPGGFIADNSQFIFSRPDRSLWQVDLTTHKISRRLDPTGQLITLRRDGSAVIFGPDQIPMLLNLAPDSPAVAGTSVPLDTCWSISSDGHRIAVAGRPYGGILIKDLDRNRTLTAPIDPRPVLAMALSPNGHQLVTAGFDGVLKIWSVETAALETSFKGFLDPIWGVAYSSDGRLLAAGGNNRVIRLWNTTDWSLADTREGHVSTVRAIAFSPDRTQMTTGGEDELALIWPIRALRPPMDAPQLLRGPGWGSPIPSLDFSPDSQLFTGTASDGTVKVWRTDDFSVQQSFPASARTVAFSSDGRFILGEDYDGTVRRWSLATPDAGETVAPKASFANWQTAPLNTQERVTLVTDQAAIRAQSGLCSITSTRDAMNAGAMLSAAAIAMSADGTTMYVGSARGEVEIWDVPTRKQRLAFAAHKLSVTSIAVSADGRHIATGSLDNTTKLWDATTGQPLATVRAHNRPVWALAFSPDGQTLAAGSCDKSVVLCSIPLRQGVANIPMYTGVPQGYEQEVRLLKFSPDGNILAAALGDGTVRFFRAAPFSETDRVPPAGKTTAAL